MPLILADRVRDTTTTTGTGTVTLSGTAPTGYQNFSVIGNGNTTYYTINAGSQWEVGIGTYSSTGPTLARNTVLESSNANALVDFAAGTKDVFVTYPSDEAVYQDGATIAAGTAILGVTNGGTGVTTSTGTGSVVLNTSPSLVTPSLGVASADSIATLKGTVGAVAYGFIGNTNTGMWSPSSDAIAFSTAGSERLRVTSAGNVGIGTTTPAHRLDVAGSGRFGTGSGNPVLFINGGSSSDQGGYLNFQRAGANSFYVGHVSGVVGGASNDGLLYSGTSNGLQIYTNNLERMRVTSAGNVGIGTSSPSVLLNVYSATGAFIDLSGDAGTTISAIRSSTDASGANLVLRKARGTTASRTAVASGDTMGTLFFSAFGGTSNRNIATIVGAVGTYTSDADISSNLLFNTTPTGSVSPAERMRITDAGNVGVGTNAPVSAFGRSLHVFNDANTGTVASNAIAVVQSLNRNGVVDIASSATGTSSLSFSTTPGTIVAGIASNIGDQSLLFRSGGTTERMRITSGGDVGIGTSSPSEKFEVANSTAAFTVMRATNSAGYGKFGVRDSGDAYVEAPSGKSISFWNTNERMRITSGGDVGIGTASPPFRLVSANSGTDGGWLYSSGAVSILGLGGYSNAADGAFSLRYDRATGGITFNGGSRDTPIERVRIDASGNVGIGTTAGLARLRVAAGGTAAAPVLGNVTNYPAFISNPDPSYGLGIGVNPADGRVWLQAQRSDSAVAYNITLNEAGGNVGIGLTNPGARLSVNGNAQVLGGLLTANNLLLQGDGTDAYIRPTNAGSALYLGASNNNYAVINSSGQFLIGTSVGGRTVCINSADNWIRQSNSSRSWLIGMGNQANYIIWDETGGGARFTVDTAGNWFGNNAIVLGGGFNNDNRIEVGQGRTGSNFAYIDLIGDTTYTDFGLRLLRGNTGPNTFSSLHHRGTGGFEIGAIDAAPVVFITSNAERMRITSGGEVYIAGTTDQGAFNLQVNGTGVWGAGAYVNGSDRSLKKEIAPLAEALDVVNALKPVTFRYKEDYSKDQSIQPGFIAQELQEALGGEVYVDGVVQAGPKHLNVAYQSLIPVLVKAIQELTARVAQLEGN